MRILITGASGMLGATMVKMLSKKFTVFGTGNSEYAPIDCEYKLFDLLNDNYDELIYWSNPDLIIHSGALTNVNYCRENPLEAFNVNGLSVKKLIDASNDSVKIIYISTDAVFPSERHMAKEVDPVFPESIYGKSKELGEFFLLSSNRSYTIIRTTIVGFNENNKKSGFLEWIINSAINKVQISLFEDVVFNPISIWDLTDEITYLIENDKISSEILHIAGNSFCTKHEFGIAALKEIGLSDAYIKKGSLLDFPDSAKRSLDQSLNSSFYQQKYERVLPKLKQTVNTIKKNYNEKNQIRK